MPTENKKTTNKKEEKSCPLQGTFCEKSKACASKTKSFLKENYKKPKFIAISAIILLAIICIFNCCEEKTKYHFSKFAIVKEVSNGSDSTFYLCQRNIPEGKVNTDTFYISCKTKVVEN